MPAVILLLDSELYGANLPFAPQIGSEICIENIGNFKVQKVRHILEPNNDRLELNRIAVIAKRKKP